MNDSKVVDFLKGIVIDGVNHASSGHPGGAMSSMDFAYILFTEYLSYDPDDPQWQGRDRFVLSAGHESMLLYSILHGLEWLTLKDLKQFRQLGSKTPGHPELGETPGVECTTGPLGQGCAMAVGFAIAANMQASRLKSNLFKTKTWALLGDGCMQEGVTYGAASMAGHLGLSDLIWFYDRNKVQISGGTDRAYSDDAQKVFEGLGWATIVIDAHSHSEIRRAIETAQQESSRPTLIIGDSVMAKGAYSMEGLSGTHGSPLPKDERARTKAKLGIPDGEEFYWPDEVGTYFRRRHADLRAATADWHAKLLEEQNNPLFMSLYSELFSNSDVQVSKVKWNRNKAIATRAAFGQALAQWCDEVLALVGGSADLEPSNSTAAFAGKVEDFTKSHQNGRNLCFGVREFPMSAISNGMAIYGGLIPFDATFLTFSDYSRPAIRLGALQKCRVIHEFTHDSFHLGEDGPTHQAVEHIMSLRLIPGHYVMRPADPQETEVLFAKALNLQAPSSLCLTRQAVPFLDLEFDVCKQAENGAWVVSGSKTCDLILFASGSELSLAIDVATELKKRKVLKEVRVISVPCWELFDEQTQNYKAEVLTDECKKRVSIEAGTTLGWERFVGRNGLKIGIDHFGESAPANELAEKYGFTTKQVTERILSHFF